MFTGIIEDLGKILAVTNNRITVHAKTVLEGTKLGDSISVNGVCLTVTKLNSDSFDADISPETMKVTALNKLRAGSAVNLERALPADGRFGGHIVSGHIDSVGNCVGIKEDGNFYIVQCKLSDKSAKYVVKKGSIAIDGISLTVAKIEGNIVEAAVIPHTFKNTNLQYLRSGDFVNVETDILAKYIEKFLSTSDNRSGISMEFLAENGF